jgi:geranylgeranyl pyrophosphate synthase
MTSERDTGQVITDLEWLVQDLLRVEEVMRAAVTSSSHQLVNDAAMHLIDAGGKRLRPALVMITSRSGENQGKRSDLSAAALELVHIATLMHDDVIDETQTRRGVMTVHARWGVEVAVLSGDYLFARGCALGAEAGGDVPGILADAIGRVCEGQIAETAAVGDPSRSVDHYFSTVEMKTAALFRAACELGASTSGAGRDVQEMLGTYGTHLGVTFQIVDDLLDLVGDPAITGKMRGSDLREGVFTLPVLVAAERDQRAAEALREQERDLDTVLALVRESGGLETAFHEAESRGRAALGAVEGLGTDRWVAALRTIVEGVLAQVRDASLTV